MRYERWSQRAAERALRPSRRLKVLWASVSYRLPDVGGAPQRISSLSYTSACSSYWFDLCLTLKMSETDTWRRACDSTICDKYPTSLHRIVRLSFFSDFHLFSDFYQNHAASQSAVPAASIAKHIQISCQKIILGHSIFVQRRIFEP